MTDTPRLTVEQAEIVTAFTGILMMPISEFHKRVEAKLGRSIWTHEFANKELWAEIKGYYREQFLGLCVE